MFVLHFFLLCCCCAWHGDCDEVSIFMRLENAWWIMAGCIENATKYLSKEQKCWLPAPKASGATFCVVFERTTKKLNQFWLFSYAKQHTVNDRQAYFVRKWYLLCCTIKRRDKSEYARGITDDCVDGKLMRMQSCDVRESIYETVANKLCMPTIPNSKKNYHENKINNLKSKVIYLRRTKQKSRQQRRENNETESRNTVKTKMNANRTETAEQ